MSPAGYWPQLQAAVEAGADSVYFGLKHFSARAKVGFDLSELSEVMRTLHSRGVRGFVTFNTLVFDHELREAARALAAIAEAGADALIIQDYGVLQLAHRIAPDLELHASTQMSITDAAGVRLAHRSGVSRVTLARELSLKEVRAIKETVDCEIEIFVHGALCVAYSGQCFSSEAWGGRSANRGQCAQACRLPYDLLVDGKEKPLGDARYLLSPGDLYALHHVPEIVDIGISSLKIEGRYKDAEYVALVTAAYRKAVDHAVAELPNDVSREEELQLEQVYSRGLGPWFLSGTNHQLVVKGRAPRHRGVFAGRVVHVSTDRVAVAGGHIDVKAGDGLVFDAADWRSPGEPEEGGNVYGVNARPDGIAELTFANGAIDFRRIREGDLVWRTADAGIARAARQYLDSSTPVRQQAVLVHVVAEEGKPLRSVWTLEGSSRLSVQVESSAALGSAHNRVLDAALVRDQFSRLGNTAYKLETVQLEVKGRPFAPASLLNGVRRDAVERLTSLQTQPAATRIQDADAFLGQALPSTLSRTREASGPPVLHVLVRTKEQLDAALFSRPGSITLDYLDLYGLKPSVEQVQAAGIAVRVASPRILKPGEERILEFLLRLECPLLIRAAGMLETLGSLPHEGLTGDFSLNAANAITTASMLQMGLQRITPTHDLNAAQIVTLATEVDADKLEVIAYGHLPVFHMEHCVFCRFLSTGTSYKDCGRPCEKHEIALRDQSGRAHPVIADVGCRNTVFGAEAQEASLHLDAWLQAGIRHYRVEFANESAGETTAVIGAFQQRLEGRTSSQQLTRALRQAAPQGTTEGSFFVPANHLSLTILQ
ncbi:MAG: U32 family peptidase [Bryobacteraceae bacterium]|nr:U32 family peptidase [Bryobacteraceae bacterium]